MATQGNPNPHIQVTLFIVHLASLKPTITDGRFVSTGMTVQMDAPVPHAVMTTYTSDVSTTHG